MTLGYLILGSSPFLAKSPVLICGSFFPVRILAGGSCKMRESPAECVRVGNYGGHGGNKQVCKKYSKSNCVCVCVC